MTSRYITWPQRCSFRVSSCSLPERSPALDRWGHRTISDQYVTDVSNIYHFWDTYKLQIFNLSALPAPSGTVIIHAGVEVILPSSQETTYAYLFTANSQRMSCISKNKMCYLKHSYMRLLSIIICYILTAIFIKVCCCCFGWFLVFDVLRQGFSV